MTWALHERRAGTALGLVLGLATAGCNDGRGAEVPSDTDTSPVGRDAGLADGGGAPAGAFERLLVADALSPVVHVVEVEPDSILESFELASPARVYASEDGTRGYAVQAEADLVSVLTSGLTLEPHGDHHDEVRAAPTLSPFEARGDNPVHFVAHGGYVALFFDNEGSAHIIDEESLASGAADVRHLSAAHPHHGVALVFHDHVLITRSELASGATRATPTGIAVHDLDGTPTGDVFGGCTGVHGEDTQGERAVFGCSEGALVVEHAAGSFTGRVIPNPPSASLPAPRIGTVVLHAALEHAIGNYGSDALSVIDPIANRITPYPLGERFLQFDLSPDGASLLVLTRGGELVVRDPVSFEELARFPATSPVSDDANHGAQNPQLAFGERLLYVTDPPAGQVNVIDLQRREVIRRIVVGGVPAKLAVLRPMSRDASSH